MDFILCVNRKPLYSRRNYLLEMLISLFDRTASGRSFVSDRANQIHDKSS